MLKDNLKKLREAKGLTKKQTALELGISERAYITYEYGEREPKLETLQKLADFYGVTTDYLLGRPEAKPPQNAIDSLVEEQSLHVVEESLLRMYFKLEPKKRAEFMQSVLEDVQKNMLAKNTEEEQKNSQEIHIFKRVARGNQSESHILPAEEIEKIRMEKLEDPDM